MSLGIVHECSFPERPEDDGFGSTDSEVTKPPDLDARDT